MVSNLVVRNKRTGYVTFVAKARVDGDSRTVEYICGLGTMTQEEFKKFQKWAHSMKDQEMRRARVLACPFAVEEKVKVEGKVAASVQQKTTVKRAKKVTVVKDKYTPEEREAQRAEFRKDYEERKGLTPVKEKIRQPEKEKGIQFTRGQTTLKKRRILDERITQLELHIKNAKTDLRMAAGRSEKWRTPDFRISDWKEKVERYTEAVRTLKKQRAELRRG